MDHRITYDDLSAVQATEGSERTLAIIEVWREILERPEINPNDEFFEVGGNSMLLLAMLEVLQDKFEREIQLDDLADGVTPSRLSALTA